MRGIMNKKELISRATSLLREVGLRKLVTLPKQNFYISDDSGNSKKFVIRPIDRGVNYTAEDVECILDALLQTIENSIKSGESIAIRNYASIGLSYKPEKIVMDLNNKGEKIKVPARFVPKFTFGPKFKMAAKTYTEYVNDELLKQKVKVGQPDVSYGNNKEALSNGD